MEQKEFLDEIFDKGEKRSSKATTENTLLKMKERFDSKNFLPLATIRAYFSRRAKRICSGEIVVGDEWHGNNNEEIGPDESESEDNECDD